ncbi:DEAD/DEAH box helicase family protein [Desulfovibrio piger]|uniref:DEAD/DEAH box helicase family protein n=2 Tax=Desulfovibrio TaxID=872 RepID=A0A848C8K0_9BACT|nr:DEAD/DEAH box helicase family protein [Desulfovibrio piger]NME51622.1 DEAD/DEAH box helicase family protein [Desulfovibrio piger]
MPNFDFLNGRQEFSLFAASAVEAEKVFATSSAMCVIGCRKALELAVKWVYTVDNGIQAPYKDNLSALIHEYTFKKQLPPLLFGKIKGIVAFGNMAVHTGKTVPPAFAVQSLKSLFEFIQWVDYSYGSDYQVRTFDAQRIPKTHVSLDMQKIRAQESLLGEKDAEIERLRQQLAELADKYTGAKERNRQSRTITMEDLSEFSTRKIYIDAMLLGMDWELEGPDSDVSQEYEVEGMAGVPGQKGYADYVLWGRDGKPLAVVEAKKACKDPNTGRTQAKLYADCLELRFGQRPVMFTTNGFDTFFWDDKGGPQRKVSRIFSKTDLERIIERRTSRLPLESITISNAITDRYYQQAAIRSVCEEISRGVRKHLLVMATGTGKTRTAASLVDVLSRGHHITNVLFLADRTALVSQAKDDFKTYLPNMSLCNLCANKDDASARIVFSTYPTIMNAIDREKSKDGGMLFSPAHFDLIIIDESHRSIFKKYRAIFEYFDAILLGLTATPKTEVARNTYEFFELENGVPTYAYDYDTAVHQDHVLVPYYNYEVTTKFLSEGITYEELSDEDKERYEDDFTEDGVMPDSIPSQALNDFVFNQKTVDLVLQDLMERGIMVNGGERIGKTIIFAQNKRHAEFILERFNKLYPQYHGTWASRVVCDDSYAQTVIDNFKEAEKTPYIVVSVDMMDTGIDVPACVNLVFFKKVRSKTKFWQMIGRGTRLCPELTCTDLIEREEYTGKKRFLIFDYCGNFEYFRQVKHTTEGEVPISLSENIFRKCVRLVAAFQDASKFDGAYQPWRRELTELCQGRIAGLNTDLFHVRLALKHVEKFKKPEAFICLSELDQQELTEHIAPLVHFDEADAMALRFDNFIYGFILNVLDESPLVKRDMARLVTTARLLEKKSSIPQVAAKLPLLRQISAPELWKDIDICKLEDIRRELRALIRFLDEGSKRKDIITILTDPILDSTAGIPLPEEDPFESYKMKVNRYIEEHKNSLAIYNLTHNISLTRKDYEELERVFTQELGSKEDYVKTFGDTPFGLLIRKIAKLDHEAVLAAFSEFINDQSLNSRQIAFVQKVITHIEQNGYIEDISVLTKAPFDKPAKLLDFDEIRQRRLLAVIKSVRDNALVI